MCFSGLSQTKSDIRIIHGYRSGISVPVSSLKISAENDEADDSGSGGKKITGETRHESVFRKYGSPKKGADRILQADYYSKTDASVRKKQGTNGTERQTADVYNGQTLQSFNGIGYTNVSPADPSLAVGPDHIIQMAHGLQGSAVFRIYQKSTGALLANKYMQSLSGAQYKGYGNSITWYDQLEDRFVMTEFGDSSTLGNNINTLIIAVSQTPDPMGKWYIYSFSDINFYPDFPKYGNWHDAWYGVTRDFTGGYIGSSLWAFNKQQMIRGENSVDVQRVRIADPDNKFYSTAPVSLIGQEPAPAGTPGLFMYFSDDDFSSDPNDTDSVGLIGFHVDFNDPSKTFLSVETSQSVSPFKSDICTGRNCATSPDAEGYDVQSTQIMNRPYYRNFGTYQSLVATHTIDVTGNALAGLRWYELRRNFPGWSVFQQGSFSPQSEQQCAETAPIHRFMGAISINSEGQIAMGFSSSSSKRYASLGFTGRNSADPLGRMSYLESDVVVGTGYGSFGNRWGDYNEIVPDISNDSIFWFTGMFGSGPVSWRTRIFSFKLVPKPLLDAGLMSIEYPNTCESFCSQLVIPRVRIRNMGTRLISSAKVNIQVNNEEVTTINWNGQLDIAEEMILTLPADSLPIGRPSLKIFLTDINGISDGHPENDSAKISVTVGHSAALPLEQGFEVSVPPSGWTQKTTGTKNLKWIKYVNASHGGKASIRFDNFNTDEKGKYGELRTPLLDISNSDSIDLNFWLAAAAFNQANVDSLEILVSADCGVNFQSVWKKWGFDLATHEGYLLNDFIPTTDEWKKVSVNLSAFAGSDKIIIAFRATNNFGNNIYIDDIGLTKTIFRFNDVQITAIDQPESIGCSLRINPSVSFVNMGRDTLRSLLVHYTVGGNVYDSLWTGKLARLESAKIELNPLNAGFGPKNFTAYLTNPNGFTDEYPFNDTLVKPFTVISMQDLPLNENFENGNFPGDRWDLMNEGITTGWEKTSLAAASGSNSVRVKNFGYPLSIGMADLISPLLTYKDADSVIIKFRLAAAVLSYPGSTQVPMDTLEVLVTTDCGKTFSSVYKKWGADLQTTGDVNLPVLTDFIPASDQWRSEKISLGSLLGPANNFLIVFRVSSNGENNIYLDDIDIATKKISALQGRNYRISPNPFTNEFYISFLKQDEIPQAVELLNSSGQRLYFRTVAPGTSQISINTSAFPAGIYHVKLIYRDKIKTEKVLRIR